MNYSSPFPKFVSFVVELNSTDILPLTTEELSQISERSVPKRVKQFQLGRSAGKRALQELGYQKNFTIKKGAEGQPMWPPGICGSISHCDDIAIAAVANQTKAKAIGVDIEKIKDSRSPSIKEKIASRSELEWIENYEANPMRNMFMLFSAKESIYKAIFSIDQTQLTWLDVELSWDPDHSAFAVKFNKHHNYESQQVKVLQAGEYIYSGILITEN